MKQSIIAVITLLVVGLWAAAAKADVPAATTSHRKAYLPLIQASTNCPTTSTHAYGRGFVSQFDTDDPVRPGETHADKNIAVRGYVLNTNSSLEKDLVDYGSDDPTQPPQFATLFSPHQVPPISGLYQVHGWNWASSPNPGQRGDPIEFPNVTAISLEVAAGTSLHAPASGYDIGGGAEVVVIYADEDTVALHYTREDTAALGYTLHIDGICTDPNLLSLYNALDNANGPRYDYPASGYELPSLPAGQPFGVSSGRDVVIAIADTGTFQDPRSCNEWWQIRPGYNGSCE